MTIAQAAPQPCDRAQAEARDRTIPCPQRDKPWILVTAILGSSLAFIEGSVVNLALPAIQSDLDATSTTLQWVVNAYLLMLGSFMLIGGSLGDRFGLRRVFVLGTILFGIASLASALAPSLPWLVAARALQGFGGALLVPNSLALVGRHFEKAERGRAIGTWAGASALTTALGPVLGGWLVDQWGWRAVFLLIPPLAVLAASVAGWRVPASPRGNEHRLDYAGALLLVAALCAFIYALVTPAARAAILSLAAVAAVAFIARERKFPVPMLPLDLFRSPAFSGANLMTLLLYAALSGAMYFLPFNLIQVQGWSALQAGAAFLPFTLILGFGSTFAGALIRTFDPRVILTIGPAVAALGLFALAIPGVGASYLTGFLPGIVILGAGMTLSVAPLTTVVMSSVEDSQAGTASGVNNTASRLAGVLAVAALTAVAVQSFAGGMEERLQGENLPREVLRHLTSNVSRLAELEAPPMASGSAAATIEGAVAHSYVATFRLLVAICGVLTALSGLIAWLTLGNDKPASRPRSPNG
jgi:EmrB/QacA subfamily drug resistance transporter